MRKHPKTCLRSQAAYPLHNPVHHLVGRRMIILQIFSCLRFLEHKDKLFYDTFAFPETYEGMAFLSQHSKYVVRLKMFCCAQVAHPADHEQASDLFCGLFLKKKMDRR